MQSDSIIATFNPMDNQPFTPLTQSRVTATTTLEQHATSPDTAIHQTGSNPSTPTKSRTPMNPRTKEGVSGFPNMDATTIQRGQSP
ncbi:hypothetical protein M011DRAFT_469598 [Sporormia fimetaria CBS 119925]|uniref:Uncharacterized protein n=1 Tax=Sporormia fimetaria CBS 119925 TaxID=1340428 RepID=A0A6A6V6P2_9PLEO|nr:hypothetical protein M011DRAFT_469598 [Sporormia fimetaria CBS 119925]